MSVKLPFKRILSFNDATRNWEYLFGYLNGKGLTTERPDAVKSGVGFQFYDTTLNKPIWSDGTDWRDASGTVV
jgi:hypothetical protein